MSLISSIIIGIIVGIIAKLLSPARDAGAWIANIVLGLIGAIIASYIWRHAGCFHEGYHPAGYLAAILGAIILLVIYRLFQYKNKKA